MKQWPVSINSHFAEVTDNDILQMQELLDLFYKCSGLKINSSKSEFLWLGPDRDSNDQVLNFLPPEDTGTVYALGVHFSYNKNAAEKKNFISKLEALKTLLNMWMIRDLSLYGKVQIIKFLALSKLTFICSVLPSPTDFESKVNSITFNFLWNNKPAKIKKSTIIANKKQGGLKMIDFTKFSIASKAMWAKHLCTEINNDWKHVPKHYLKSVGKELVFSCNYDSKLVATIDCPPFYKTVLHVWQEIHEIVPIEKSDIKDEIIRNNKFITVNKTSLYYKSWHEAGVTKVSDLLNSSSFYTYKQFVEKYKIRMHFLQYYSLVNAIPLTWKKKILSSNNWWDEYKG